MRPLGEDPKQQAANGLRIPPTPVAHYLPTDTCQDDPDLARVVDAWDRLPDAIRAGILAMVKAASGK